MAIRKEQPRVYASELLRKVDGILQFIDGARLTSFEGNQLTVDGKPMRDSIVELRKLILTYRRQNRIR